MPPRTNPLEQARQGKPVGVVSVKPAPPTAKRPAGKATVERPKAAGTYTLRAKAKKAQIHSAGDQLAQSEYIVEFIDEKGNVVGEAPITSISEIPESIADDEIDATVDLVLEVGPNGEMEEVFYTCIGKKFLISKPDGTVAVECRGIEIVW